MSTLSREPSSFIPAWTSVIKLAISKPTKTCCAMNRGLATPLSDCSKKQRGLAQAIKDSNKVRSSTQANAHSEGSQGPLAAPIVEHDFECLDAMDVQEQEANYKRLDVVEDTLQAIEAVKQEFSQWQAKLDEPISVTEEQVAAEQAVEQQRYEQRLKDVQIMFDKRVTELQEEQQRTIERRLRDEKNRYKDKLGENARDYDERLKAL